MSADMPHDPLKTPLEPTISPAELTALREAARSAGELDSAIHRPSAVDQSEEAVDETIPHPLFEEPTIDDNGRPQTPLDPTLDPADLKLLLAIAAESKAPRPVRPRAPAEDDTLPYTPTPEVEPPMPETPKVAEAVPAIAAEPISAPAELPQLAQTLAASAPIEAEPAKTAPPASPDNRRTPDIRRMWQLVVPTCLLLAIVMLLANFLPFVVVQWRRAEAHAEADAAYLRRRAELKAESESASEQLVALDGKAKLVSLGFRYAVAKVLPSVVNIANLKGATTDAGAIAGDTKFTPSSIGSGILIRPGYLLTNFHVVQGGDRLRVAFASGRIVIVEAAAVSSDPVTDLAVIKLPEDVSEALKEDMKQTAVFADSDKDIEVGDWSLAIGSPMGLRQTVTSGIISAKNRLIDKLEMVELLQTDAAISPGNSGGPLFDQLGRVVGINVALASENGFNRGIGFAIPSNTAVKIANAIIEHGEVVRGYLGIEMKELPLEKAKLLGLGSAVVVTRVPAAGAGDKAGLQTGDIIAKYDGKPLEQFNAVRHLRQLIIDTAPGTDVPIEIYRNDNPQSLTATIAKRPKFVQ